ncbi:hypothetical protein PUNSTDRAFT_87432 [Punctularia strigosozonata HHB-11173 SS5]|uniref:uncharacterized protein n=1 Tax=Punctularia strigosozonata (strain HHB-11173) TaxID=741275 RepID=UPI00044185A7|nr:uncharacterized protein PUNSTDRAFT_87432 [Punctularia strigosozonata HHB-11173 SS5]EIN09370.1 hypothetical protein PUNSTDRAFT_87432 [Punctularia strigosozonata HHB-11173 SS5]
MASYLSRSLAITRPCGARLRINLAPGAQLRALHVTAVARKRKSPAATEELDDDLFGAAAEDELFPSASSGSGASARTTTSATSSTSSTSQPPTRRRVGKLTEDERRERFNRLYEHVSQRIGREPPVQDATSTVRNTAFTHLFDMAQTPQELEKVTELFAPFWTGKRELHAQESENFVRRCCELGCPSLAIRIFGDRPRHGVSLPSLSAGRRLLHALSLQTPVPATDVVTMAALYRVYALPAIASDLHSCALMVSACYEAGGAHAGAIAAALLPSLRKLVEGTKPEAVRVPRHPGENQWLRVALRDVREQLRRRKQDVAWLDQWMVEAGYARPTQLGLPPAATAKAEAASAPLSA